MSFGSGSVEGGEEAVEVESEAVEDGHFLLLCSHQSSHRWHQTLVTLLPRQLSLRPSFRPSAHQLTHAPHPHPHSHTQNHLRLGPLQQLRLNPAARCLGHEPKRVSCHVDRVILGIYQALVHCKQAQASAESEGVRTLEIYDLRKEQTWWVDGSADEVRRSHPDDPVGSQKLHPANPRLASLPASPIPPSLRNGCKGKRGRVQKVLPDSSAQRRRATPRVSWREKVTRP